LEWNTTAAIAVRKQIKVVKEDDDEESEWESDPLDSGVICYIWQDNNTVIACSTVGQEHTIISIQTMSSNDIYKWISRTEGLWR
jgi:hypothetical protein